MGYTHYYHKLGVDKDLATFASRAIALSDVKICGVHGVGKPYISDDAISLNGSRADGEEFEDFVIGDPDKLTSSHG